MKTDNDLVARQLDFLRKKLIDLTNRNKLTNFKHSDRSRTHIRIVDELPDVILELLLDGKSMEFLALPDPDSDPEDEKTARFLKALEEATLTDDQYLRELEQLEDSQENIGAVEKIERALKDRLRVKLGLPRRIDPDDMSLREFAKSVGIDPSYDLPEPIGRESGPQKHYDDKLQTLLRQQRMDRKLSGVYDLYRLALQELGVNTLFICFGWLDWAPRDDVKRRMCAPLMLQQIDLQRTKARGRFRYKIVKADDDVMINLALSERLKYEFGFEVPAFEESPESYLKKLSGKIKQADCDWRVRRWITVGHFSFAKLAMYHDLDPKNWAGTGVTPDAHPVIRELLLGSESDAPFFAAEYDIDDYSEAKALPQCIADADASQLSTIIDVVSGRNMAVKGPPGTGKSQTITNIIAAVLAEGKSVLFVAEKNAALQVVKKRLDDARLGQFCLELHSTKSTKSELKKSLELRLDCQHRLDPPTNYDERLTELKRIRASLNQYYRILDSRPYAIGLPLLDILWTTQNLARKTPHLEGFGNVVMPDAQRIGPAEFDDLRQLLQKYATADDAVTFDADDQDGHPWRGVCCGSSNPFKLGEL